MSLRTTRLFSIATLAIAGTLGACAAPAPPSAPEPLWGSEWRLQSIAGQVALPVYFYRGNRARTKVARVVAFQGLQQKGGILDRPGHRAEVVERPRKGCRAVEAKAAKSRFEPD